MILPRGAVIFVVGIAAFFPRICAADQTAELADGSVYQAEYGHVVVPERREAPTSSTITIPYIRLFSESEQTAAPVIYLEGGPGGSGIEALEDEDFTEPFRHILENRDLVLVDQRGTGDAEPELECWRNYTFPLVPSPTPDERLEVIKRLASDCAEQMRIQGIDLAGYNTNESADDIADLARHLSADKVILLGGSYGSHLALAVLRHTTSTAGRIASAISMAKWTAISQSAVMTSSMRPCCPPATPSVRASISGPPCSGPVGMTKLMAARTAMSSPPG